jgi:hypothetical protein
MSDKFHQNFQVGLQAHPLGYKGVNLGCMMEVRKQTRQQTRAWMQTKKHVATCLQLI